MITGPIDTSLSIHLNAVPLRSGDPLHLAAVGLQMEVHAGVQWKCAAEEWMLT